MEKITYILYTSWANGLNTTSVYQWQITYFMTGYLKLIFPFWATFVWPLPPKQLFYNCGIGIDYLKKMELIKLELKFPTKKLNLQINLT